MVRLFVGSFLKEDEAARVDRFCQENKERLSALSASALRFVEAANLHITWVFLGEVEEQNVPTVQKEFKREVAYLKEGTIIEAQAITKGSRKKKTTTGGLGDDLNIDVEYDYIEAWPTVSAGRVLVATPTTVPDEVLKIGMSLRTNMSNLGKVDQGEVRNLLFRPHITLMRAKPEDNFGDGRLLNAMKEVLPLRQQIDSLHLIKSQTGPEASHYEVIESAY